MFFSRAIRTVTGTLAVNYNNSLYTVKCYCHALETENLSLWDLYEGSLGEELLYWDPEGYAN